MKELPGGTNEDQCREHTSESNSLALTRILIIEGIMTLDQCLMTQTRWTTIVYERERKRRRLSASISELPLLKEHELRINFQ
jgi:cell division protein ZapA (FtsZ GTPase activity inhibitor)